MRAGQPPTSAIGGTILLHKHMLPLPPPLQSQHRTDLLTQTAIYTKMSIYLRIQKAFGILPQGYAMLGTSLHTGRTAAAVLPINNLYHDVNIERTALHLLSMKSRSETHKCTTNTEAGLPPNLSTIYDSGKILNKIPPTTP